MGQVHLSELLDIESVQVIQDSFSKMTGMASVLTDENGTPITKGSNFTTFCYELTRRSAIGKARCEKCDRSGAKETMKSGRVTVYSCHAGLCDFAAPIIVDGRFMGAFVGGQVLLQKPDEDQIRQVAWDLGIDPEAYVSAVRKIPVISKEKMEEAAGFLYKVANVMSTMAYTSYINLVRNREFKNVTKMKNEFISTVNYNLMKPLQEMLFLAQSINRSELSEDSSKKLYTLEKMNQKVINALADAMEYSELTKFDSEIVETDYNLHNRCEGLNLTYQGRLLEKNVKFELQIDEDVPVNVFGDATRIRQILANLLNNSVQYTNEGKITLHVSVKRTTYGILVVFEIRDTGVGMPREQLEDIRHMFAMATENQAIDEDMLKFGLGLTSQLVAAVYGKVQVESTPGEGTAFVVTIPQIATSV